MTFISISKATKRQPKISNDKQFVLIEFFTPILIKQNKNKKFIFSSFAISISPHKTQLFQYELRLAASDNLKENYTTVVIHVKDVNDNPPVFERPTYRTQITEEDDRNLPKRVLQVLEKFLSFSPSQVFLFAVFFFPTNKFYLFTIVFDCRFSHINSHLLFSAFTSLN